MNEHRIPATIITGFLGAGKTTLIQNLIKQTNGRRFAFIVNEFGDIGFDGELLGQCGNPTCHSGDIIELTNGCICCTVADDFLPTIETLLARDPKPDHIIIETSGLALPQPLVRAFTWPSIRNSVTVDAVVSVVDAEAVAKGYVAHDEAALKKQRAADEALDHETPIEDLFDDQIKCADLIILSKSDLINREEIARVHQRIDRSIRPNVKRLMAGGDLLPIQAVLGLQSAAEMDLESRQAHHEHGDNDHDHDHDEFVTFSIESPIFSSLDAVRDKVEIAMQQPGVLRIKGRARIKNKQACAYIQAVGERVEAWFGPLERQEVGLVVIGLHDFDQNVIMKALEGDMHA